MALDDKINQIDNAKDPSPTDDEEEHEYNDAYHVLLGKSDAQSYKQFHYPAYEGKDKENNFKKSALTVKPLVKRHLFISFYLIIYLYYSI